MTHDTNAHLIWHARDYVARNAAETGADSLITDLADALERSSERTEEAVKAERERCAKIAEPKGPRPCDCEYGACYCRNAGDAAAVASWDADMAVARAIRAPVSGSTEAGK